MTAPSVLSGAALAARVLADPMSPRLVFAEREALARHVEALTEALERMTYIARNLHGMIPREVWRDSGGDDQQGHYEGDYRAEQIRDELAALAARPSQATHQTFLHEDQKARHP